MKKKIIIAVLFLFAASAAAAAINTRFANFYRGTLMGQIGPTAATLTIKPDQNAGDPPAGQFPATIYWAGCGNATSCAFREIVILELASGNTFSIISRATESTMSPSTWAYGSKVTNEVTAGVMNAVIDAVNAAGGSVASWQTLTGTAPTVNGKSIASNPTLTAGDVGAEPSLGFTPVPNTRKVCNQALSSDVTCTAGDVGARAFDWVPAFSEVTSKPSVSCDGGTTLGAWDLQNNTSACVPAGSGASSFDQLSGSPYSNASLSTALDSKVCTTCYATPTAAGVAVLLWTSGSNSIAPANNTEFRLASQNSNTNATITINKTVSPIADRQGDYYASVTRNGGSAMQSFMHNYYVGSGVSSVYDIGMTNIIRSDKPSGSIWAEWLVSAGSSTDSSPYGIIGTEINTFMTGTDTGYKESRNPGFYSVGMQMVPESELNVGRGTERGYNGNFGILLGRSSGSEDGGGRVYPSAKWYVPLLFDVDSTAIGGTNALFSGASTTGNQANYGILFKGYHTNGIDLTQATYSGSPLLSSSVTGSTSSGGTLTLRSTSHATKGKTILGSASAYDEANDRLGIGTLSPAKDFEIVRDGSSGVFQVTSYGSVKPSIFLFKHAKGSLASPSALTIGDQIGWFQWSGYGASAFSTPARWFEAAAGENWTNYSQGVTTNFYAQPQGTNAFGGSISTMSLNADGGLYLGTVPFNPAYQLDVKARTSLHGIVFTGTGLNDLTSLGTPTFNTSSTYNIIIDGTGTPDTFKWNKNGGSYTTGVAITGSNQAVVDGISIRFNATTGHTLNDQWAVSTVLLPALRAQTSSGATIIATDDSGNVGIGTTSPKAALDVGGAIVTAVTPTVTTSYTTTISDSIIPVVMSGATSTITLVTCNASAKGLMQYIFSPASFNNFDLKPGAAFEGIFGAGAIYDINTPLSFPPNHSAMLFCNGAGRWGIIYY